MGWLSKFFGKRESPSRSGVPATSTARATKPATAPLRIESPPKEATPIEAAIVPAPVPPPTPRPAVQPKSVSPDLLVEPLLCTRGCALSDCYVEELHVDNLVVLSPNELKPDGRIDRALKWQGSAFAKEACNLRKLYSPLSEEIDIVKWLVLDHSSMGRFCRNAKDAGFQEEEPIYGHGRRFTGLDSEFIVSAANFIPNPDYWVFNLVFKEHNSSSQTIVSEGRFQFPMHRVDPKLGVKVGKLLSSHRERILPAGMVPQFAALEEFLSDDVMAVIGLHASPYIAATRAGERSQSIALRKGQVFYVIQIVPTTIDEASAWFSREYGGYTRALERCWNSTRFKQVKPTLLCHVVIGTGGTDESKMWANLTTFPWAEGVNQYPAVMAIDLFSEFDRSSLQAGQHASK